MDANGTVWNTPMVDEESPYARMTMKDLVRKALGERFKDGATAAQLIEFFRNAWDRHIERANLSPQLSRLKQDREIDRRGNVWFLVYGTSETVANDENGPRMMTHPEPDNGG